MRVSGYEMRALNPGSRIPDRESRNSYPASRISNPELQASPPRLSRATMAKNDVQSFFECVVYSPSPNTP